ncbi:hypothetical protein [Porphyromonas sp.]
MNEVYVLAIGGSGARVLRSLVMLLAAGVEPNAKIIPLIIDPDSGAGNLSQTIELLKLYTQIREEAQVDNADPLVTFSTPIEMLPGAGYQVQLDQIAGTKFREYIDLGVAMSGSSQALLRSLFSKENLDLEMTIGFKGNPNIGSIVLGQFEGSDAYKRFFSELQKGDIKKKSIFIISSIFGGTGASGFPSLLKSLRSSSTLVSQMRMGALSLLPYFNLENNASSAIDSATFYAKTRAALSYYTENIIKNADIDDFYFIGDKSPNSYSNSDGGQTQRNQAHLVELAGALSIIHFARLGSERPKSSVGTMYEFGLDKPVSDAIGFKTLGDATERELAVPLTSLYLMHRFLEEADIFTDKDPWLKEIQANLGDGSFIDDINRFLELYKEWLQELGGHSSHGFKPFEIGVQIDNLFNCVLDYPLQSKGFFKSMMSKTGLALFRDKLNKLAKGNQPTTYGALLNMLSTASCELSEDEIKLPIKPE